MATTLPELMTHVTAEHLQYTKTCHVTAVHTKTCHVTAVHNKTCHVTAVRTKTCHVTAVTLRRVK